MLTIATFRAGNNIFRDHRRVLKNATVRFDWTKKTYSDGRSWCKIRDRTKTSVLNDHYRRIPECH
jgi:hypothetical protein